MRYLPISKIPLVEEETASAEVKELYEAIRQTSGSLAVGYMGMAHSPLVLHMANYIFGEFMQNTILPPPLLFMIHYAISTTKNCICCSVGFKNACQSVGVDEEMLEALINDLDAVAPKRMQEIIRFAVTAALDPQSLVEEDYDRLRDQGVSEQELTEILFWASYAMLNDTMADASKWDDPTKQQILQD